MRIAPMLGLMIVSPLVLLLAVRSSQSAPQPAEPAVAAMPTQNPHWRDDGCAMCHTTQSGAIASIPPAEVDLLCLGCHDGTRAPREPHPIGRLFAGDQVRRPEGWPVVNDRLSCLTCHDVLMHCKTSPQRPSLNPKMIRGPRLEGAAYCGQCHVSDLHQQHNPHQMVDGQGAPRPDSCRYCHSAELPAGKSASRTGNAALNQSETTLCAQCHRQHLDFFSPGHIGIAPSSVVLEQMQQTGLRLGDTRFERIAVHDVLPLSDGRVGCSTCHNPHQEGVFETDSELGLGAMRWPKSPNQLPAQRLPGRELCSACHGF